MLFQRHQLVNFSRVLSREFVFLCEIASNCEINIIIRLSV